MTRVDLRSLPELCRNDNCGQPAAGARSGAPLIPRQLTFVGDWWLFYAKYRCPRCGTIRLFRRSFWDNTYVEIDEAKAAQELGRYVPLTIVVALVVWGASSLHSSRQAKARVEAQANARAKARTDQEFVMEMTDELNKAVQVTAEGAEVYQERELQVLLAVRLRDASVGKDSLFVPLSGYFLDQNGTRYDPHPIRADGTREPMAADTIIGLVPGQTYRYYLTARIPSDPTTDAPPSQRVTKVLLTLRGSATQEVPLRAARK